MKRVLLCNAVLTLSVTACTHPLSSDRPDVAQATTSATSPDVRRAGPIDLSAQVLGTWKLVSVDGKSVPANQLLITFRQQSFEAQVHCNRVSGRYTLRANTFVPEQALATEKGCGPEYEFDEAITRALQFGMVLTMPSRDRLEGQTSKGRIVLVRTAG